MASWPVSLPQALLQSGFGETLPDTALRTEMDAGPAKLRRRTSAAVRPVSGALLLTASQAADLETFYVDTLEGGTLDFTWTDPRTESACTFRFTAPPSLAPVSGALWRASISLEQMP
ncbi:MAG: hypothetical protein RLZZ524_848 [Pseudomonadota bacterium]